MEVILYSTCTVLNSSLNRDGGYGVVKWLGCLFHLTTFHLRGHLVHRFGSLLDSELGRYRNLVITRHIITSKPAQVSR